MDYGEIFGQAEAGSRLQAAAILTSAVMAKMPMPASTSNAQQAHAVEMAWKIFGEFIRRLEERETPPEMELFR